MSSVVLQNHQHPPKRSRAVPGSQLAGCRVGSGEGFFSSCCEVLQPNKEELSSPNTELLQCNPQGDSAAVRVRPALPWSLPLLRLLASGCFAFPLLVFCCSPSWQQWGRSSASLQLAPAPIPGHSWAGQSGNEAEGLLLVLVMHSWTCSSGRCEHQGSANIKSECKAAGGVQMATLISCALHCRDWKMFLIRVTSTDHLLQSSKLLLDQVSASATPCLLLQLLHPWPGAPSAPQARRCYKLEASQAGEEFKSRALSSCSIPFQVSK